MRRFLLLILVSVVCLSIEAKQSSTQTTGKNVFTIRYNVIHPSNEYVTLTILECSVPGVISNRTNEVYIPTNAFNSNNGYTVQNLVVLLQQYSTNGNLVAKGTFRFKKVIYDSNGVYEINNILLKRLPINDIPVE